MQDIKSQYDDVLTFWKSIKELGIETSDIDFDKVCDKIDQMEIEHNLDNKRLLTHLNVAYLRWLGENKE